MSRQLTPLLFVFSTFCVAILMTRIALVEDDALCRDAPEPYWRVA